VSHGEYGESVVAQRVIMPWAMRRPTSCSLAPAAPCIVRHEDETGVPPARRGHPGRAPANLVRPIAVNRSLAEQLEILPAWRGASNGARDQADCKGDNRRKSIAAI
jgi:hypothetical protein